MANENKYTPATIGDELFSIPLYQRLFEWTQEEIKQLLQDLYDSLKKARELKIIDNAKPYYIGMLTAFESEGKSRIDLVDGQQRFTVMMLFAIALKWENFYCVDGELRLTFYAREQDTEYIKYLCNLGNKPKYDYFNQNMKNGIDCINTFFEGLPTEEERNNLNDYIYNNMTFFISTLPNSYKLSDLNKYFESMNSAGKALENHEILKVKLLKNLSSNKNEYTKLWNIISDMDKTLLRKKKEDKQNESAADFRKRYSEAFKIAKQNPLNFFSYEKKKSILNDIYISSDEEKTEYKSIKDIVASGEKPKEKELNTSEVGLFSFPLFLLLILYITLDDSEIAVAEFFKVNNLLTTFDEYKDKFETKTFLDNLIYFRLVLDYFFIRLGDEEKPYILKNYVFDDDEEIGTNGTVNSKQKLIQFQSMLFVSSTPVTYYRWICPIFNYIKDTNESLSPDKFLNKLKEIDNSIEEHASINLSTFNYKEINRYWFWRLDYYLWENRDSLFKNPRELQIANNYVFKRNRSIEHIAPQTPLHNSVIQWTKENEKIRDSFGNLAMISSGQNSSLQNESYEVKHEYVRSYINGSKTDSIESLKMLKIYEAENWNIETIKKHENEMIEILKRSFDIQQ